MPVETDISARPGKSLSIGALAAFLTILLAGLVFIGRENFILLLLWQAVLHLLYVFIYKKRFSLQITHFIYIAIAIRICVAFTMPGLSEDVYRFVWDGQLLADGINPMLSTPDSYINTINFTHSKVVLLEDLHPLINHPQYYTCYPPVIQAISWLSALLSNGSIEQNIIILKILLALADGVTIFFLAKILQQCKVQPQWVLLYALHPLIIIEGAGNAHFEVLQAALISGSIYLATTKKWIGSAIIWGLAISTKLLPLMLLPLWWHFYGIKKGFLFCLMSTTVFILTFLPFLSWQTVRTFTQSIGLFIHQFEFNASLYYLFRQVGFWFTGYNQIAVIGPLLLVLFLACYGRILYRTKLLTIEKFAATSTLILGLYFICSTTVHPWYVITFLPFALIAQRMTAFIWMSLAFLSYSAYTSPVTAENYWLIALEYGVVFAVFYSEQVKKVNFFFNNHTQAK